jgi:beta-lactam-binding protein with PASTA domain
MLKTFVLMACFAFSAAVLAQVAPTAGDEDGLQMIVKQQKALKADLEDGGIEGLTPRQNTIVRKAQIEVFAVSEGKSRLDELSMDEKIRLENALERINAEIVNTRAASNNQNVC